MHSIAKVRSGRAAIRLAPLFLLAACGNSPAPAPPPRPVDGALALREDWKSRVVVDREDSIILVLPSGEHQLQRIHRHAVFGLSIAADGAVSLRLDSITADPASASDHGGGSAATWTGRIDDNRVNSISVASGGDRADELGSIVRNLLPRYPAGGARPGSTWTDSAAGKVRVDIFSANEHRRATWTVGRDANGVTPVKMHEAYEQIGTGSQGGHRLTMTAQGGRSAVYYSTKDGRLTSAQLTDSTAMLISLPDSRQVVPTMRYGRVAVRFLPAARDTSE